MPFTIMANHVIVRASMHNRSYFLTISERRRKTIISSLRRSPTHRPKYRPPTYKPLQFLPTCNCQKRFIVSNIRYLSSVSRPRCQLCITKLFPSAVCSIAFRMSLFASPHLYCGSTFHSLLRILELYHTWRAVKPPTLLELCRVWPSVTQPTLLEL